MTRREQCRPVLEAELGRWSAKPIAQLIAELKDVQAYQVKFEATEYEVEVELLENTGAYIHVMDDGRFPSAYYPLTESFVLNKPVRPR